MTESMLINHKHESQEQDIANFQDIITSQLNDQAHSSNAIRLGKKGGPKPRLLGHIKCFWSYQLPKIDQVTRLF